MGRKSIEIVLKSHFQFPEAVVEVVVVVFTVQYSDWTLHGSGDFSNLWIAAKMVCSRPHLFHC